MRDYTRAFAERRLEEFSKAMSRGAEDSLYRQASMGRPDDAATKWAADKLRLRNMRHAYAPSPKIPNSLADETPAPISRANADRLGHEMVAQRGAIKGRMKTLVGANAGDHHRFHRKEMHKIAQNHRKGVMAQRRAKAAAAPAKVVAAPATPKAALATSRKPTGRGKAALVGGGALLAGGTLAAAKYRDR